MADGWTFYSPTLKVLSAGDLLKAIPSDRIWRLERVVSHRGEELVEKVRAAEQLLGLDARAGLQNDADATVTLRVRDPTAADRASLSDAPFGPADLEVVAEVALSSIARANGHVDLCDDVLAALDTLFPGGFATHSNGEVVDGSVLRSALNAEHATVTHVDLAYHGDARQRAFCHARLLELGLPPAVVVDTPQAVVVRARLPLTLTAMERAAATVAMMELAKFASAGHVRFRERGVWRDAVSNIGVQVVPLPDEAPRGMLHRLAHFLRPK